ncbi:MAG: FAD-dependent monooxygenase [Chloroflexota bacterium]|nr:FAD-dependent monooxygenase [Chloroflexota bacterium]
MPGSPLGVVIVGGGLGGLCLAQGLRQAGVGVTVYERDASPDVRHQGYRIHIDQRGAQGLAACLPPPLYDLVVATAGRPGRQVTVLTHHLKTRRIVRFAGEAAAPRPASAALDAAPLNAAVNRRTLREILLAGLDDVVHFGKEFTHYEQGADGRLCAHFADGTRAEGDVLVAADGTGSRVRRQYLPHAAVVDTGARCIYGKTPLTAETRPLVPAAVADGFTAVVGPHAIGLALGLMEFRHRPEAAAAALDPRVPVHPADDYLMWGVTAQRERVALTDAELLALDGPALQQVALRLTARWHASVGALIARCAVAETFALTIRTAVPLAPWPTTTVTLLGDAIHAMSPAGGSGANTALRDAGLLCRHLVAAARGETPLLMAIGAYENEMVAYGFDAVRASQQAPGRFFNATALVWLTHGLSGLAHRLRSARWA